MATGTDKDYWASQALPSVLKHKLLGQYIPRFGGMTGSRGGKVVYLDGYAGEGRYQSGDAGSAELAMQVAAHHLEKNALLWNCGRSTNSRRRSRSPWVQLTRARTCRVIHIARRTSVAVRRLRPSLLLVLAGRGAVVRLARSREV